MKRKLSRQTHLAALLLAFCVCSAAYGQTADQKLSDLTLVKYHQHDGDIVVDTSGTAKLKISFLTPTMARVQIAPDGTFPANASPAVAQVLPALLHLQILDRPAELVLKSTGLSLHLDKAHLRVDAYQPDDKHPLSLEDPVNGTSWNTTSGAVHQGRLLDDTEHIYGLGEDNANHGTLDRRGTVRDLWTGQQIRSGNVTANYPVPFYLSSGIAGRGYGVFVDNVWRMKFDVGKTDKSSLTWSALGGPIDFYVINGPSFKVIIDQYTKLTGRPTMLPLYAFGYWQSRCFFESFADIQHTVDRLKSGGLPLDVLVIDSDWSNHEMDFKWKPEFLSGKPAADWLAGLHAGGASVMLSTKGPMIRKDTDVYAEALADGLFATDGHGHTLTTGYYGGDLLDFTQPAIKPWLAKQLKPLSAVGIDSWWLDLIEPEGEPPQAVYYAGKSAAIHNTYPLLNFKAYFDYQRSYDPTGRPVILGRAASAGTQHYSGIVWTGDINSDWPTFQAHIPEAQNSGLSGLPYWTNDSGGFISGFLNNDRYGAHAELYERWFEFTSFAPITRAHKAGPSEPYEFGPEVEAAAKKYLQLRYRLLPYIYTMAHETATTGMPMVRPLVLEFQNDPGSATAKTEYLFGNSLLVAPVLWPHAVARQVYFPPGQWISYDEGFELTGGTTMGVSAPRDRIPVFVRAGAILPMAPDMMFTAEKPWNPITLEVWPSHTSTASLYQDDNLTTAFTHGESTLTTFRSLEKSPRSLSFTIQPSNRKFGPAQWIVNFHLTSVPTAVRLDGSPVRKNDPALPDTSFSSTKDLSTLPHPVLKGTGFSPYAKTPATSAALAPEAEAGRAPTLPHPALKDTSFSPHKNALKGTGFSPYAKTPATSGALAPEASWTFDPATSILSVNLPGAHLAHALAITLDGSSHPRPTAPHVDAPPPGSEPEFIPTRELPQFLPAPKLPTQFGAANFDKGGEGLAFHIARPVQDSVYRQEGVPIINSTDEGGGYAIPGLQKGDSLSYTLDAGSGGWFTISARVLAATQGRLEILRKPFKPLTSIDIPSSSGGLPKWIRVEGQSLFYLPPGEFILSVHVAQPGFQLGSFSLNKASEPVVTTEAETGTILGAGISTDHPGYTGTGFVSGISSKKSSVTIPLSAPAAGRYWLALRYANGGRNAEVALRLGDQPGIVLPLPSTDDWAAYAEAGTVVTLKAGQTSLEIRGLDQGIVNIDQLKLFPLP